MKTKQYATPPLTTHNRFTLTALAVALVYRF